MTIAKKKAIRQKLTRHWKEFTLLGKGPGGKEIKLPYFILFDSKGTMRARVQCHTDGMFEVVIGRPGVALSDLRENEWEAKQLAETTLREWGL